MRKEKSLVTEQDLLSDEAKSRQPLSASAFLPHTSGFSDSIALKYDISNSRLFCD